MPAVDPLHRAGAPAASTGTPLEPVQADDRLANRGQSGAEQRREHRRMLGTRPAGDLVLYPTAELARRTSGLDPAAARSAGTGIKVEALRDISASGLSVYVGSALAPGQALTIELRSATMQLDFGGMVVWCARAQGLDGARGQPPADHVVGLALPGQQLLASMLGL
jgi:hypothetical protein